MAKRSKGKILSTGKEALRQEIARYQKGGSLISRRQMGKKKKGSFKIIAEENKAAIL